jgi:hypothetical protein
MEGKRRVLHIIIPHNTINKVYSSENTNKKWGNAGVLYALRVVTHTKVRDPVLLK